MDTIILVLFILAFVDSIVILVIKTYNKLVKLRNELNSNYADLNTELSNKVNKVREYIPVITPHIDKQVIDELNLVLIQFNMKVSIADIANIYYNINNKLAMINQTLKDKQLSFPEWDKVFDECNSRIEAVKVIYDDNVLKMNNIVDMAPTNIVAKMFGFVKWPYFRSQ